VTKHELLTNLRKLHQNAVQRQTTNKRYDAQLRARGTAKALQTAIETVELLDERK